MTIIITLIGREEKRYENVTGIHYSQSLECLSFYDENGENVFIDRFLFFDVD